MTSPATRPAITPGALTRYKVMAIITGTLLIVVFVGMIRYIPGLEGLKESIDPTMLVIAQIHGFVYMVYLVTVLQLWLQAKWGYGRLATMFFGGIVPFLSFVVERRISDELAPKEATA
ncbi:DUF3817 domain-containing protein [Demequina sp. NBRC 110057]|uniref:DUF3817 domain-containing protein n=1 Tax=Demequina sp. NBRC 110057 TaxID=1570346 RepID=UPI000A01EE9C|nr:DUF3817 domain-containing protein [Demequina sp. NBRC 110057]